jgi:MinD superfamily P-loop ATPase
MKELVIISGKGGTGKTSVTASFAALAKNSVLADCDVDAADLFLVLAPKVTERHDFYSGHEAIVRTEDCVGCGLCAEYCRFDALRRSEDKNGKVVYTVDPPSCEGCRVCVEFCPQKAIDFPERLCGEWMISETRLGPMVHAKLGVAAENSGKLVSTVRKESQILSANSDRDLVIVDGPPGIGCPVIASLAGANLVLVVTEPTLSGEHDMERVVKLTKHFKIPVAICVNKWDLNPEITERIEGKARQVGVHVAGRIRYDREVTQAQMQARAVVETEAACAEDVRGVWSQVQTLLNA